MDFGIRSKPPCGDCWEDGHCSMNCGPKIIVPRADKKNTENYQRDKDDFFPTPLECTIAMYMIEKEHMPKQLWEPACGEGHISQYLEDMGHDVISTDLVYRGFGTAPVDFLKAGIGASAIVTNPPWKLSDKFIRHALFDLDVQYLALLLPANWWHASTRTDIFEKNPYARELKLGWRPDLFGIGSPDQRCCVSWYVWDSAATEKRQTIILRRPSA